jgi:hypothetical protein
MDQNNVLNSEQMHSVIQAFIESVRSASNELIHLEQENMHVVINIMLDAWLNFTKQVLQDQEKLNSAQIAYWQDYLVLCENLHVKLSLHPSTVRQKVSRNHVLLKFVELSYALIAQHVSNLLKNIFNENNAEDSKRIAFYTREISEGLNLTALLEGAAFAQPLN